MLRLMKILYELAFEKSLLCIMTGLVMDLTVTILLVPLLVRVLFLERLKAISFAVVFVFACACERARERERERER